MPVYWVACMSRIMYTSDLSVGNATVKSSSSSPYYLLLYKTDIEMVKKDSEVRGCVDFKLQTNLQTQNTLYGIWSI